jgi:hypothetical protein
MAFTENDIAKITGIQSGQNPAPAPAAPTETSTATPTPSNNTPAPTNTPAPAIPAAPAATTPPTNNTPPADENEYIELSQLGVESYEQLQERLQRYQELEKEVQELNEYKAGPKFANDRQKFLYDYATRFDGMELSKARQLLEIAELKLDSLPDQQVRFEAFKLDPNNKGLSQDEMYKLFMHQEITQFGDVSDEGNPPTDVQKIQARLATAKAKETLSGVLKEWESTRPVQKSPEDLAKERIEYRQFLNKQLPGFEGINLKLAAIDEKGEKLEGALNFKLDDSQKAEVLEALADPAGWWDRMMEESGVMSNGAEQPDFQKFADLVTQIKYGKHLQDLAYQQGRSDALADKLKTSRNVSDPSTGAGATPEPPKLDDKTAANRAFMKTVGIV